MLIFETLEQISTEPYFSKIALNHFYSAHDFLKLSLTFLSIKDYNYDNKSEITWQIRHKNILVLNLNFL